MKKILTHWTIAFITLFVLMYIGFKDPQVKEIIRLKGFDLLLQSEERQLSKDIGIITIDEKSKVKPVYPENELKRTQDLRPVYFDCGQFYWGKKENWLNSTKIHSNGLGYILPNWRVVDLDTEQDWKRAELLKKIIK